MKPVEEWKNVGKQPRKRPVGYTLDRFPSVGSIAMRSGQVFFHIAFFPQLKSKGYLLSSVQLCCQSSSWNTPACFPTQAIASEKSNLQEGRHLTAIKFLTPGFSKDCCCTTPMLVSVMEGKHNGCWFLFASEAVIFQGAAHQLLIVEHPPQGAVSVFDGRDRSSR